MLFRKLYWVAEDLLPSGAASLRGVFTSVPNLIRLGIPDRLDPSRFRLTLTRLDSTDGVVARWSGPDFDHLSQDLAPFVVEEDFTEEQRRNLVERIPHLQHSKPT
jgi:hypothetical protein